MKVNVSFIVNGKKVEWSSSTPILMMQGDVIDDVSASTIISIIMGELKIPTSQKELVRNISILHDGKTIYYKNVLSEENCLAHSSYWKRHKVDIIMVYFAILSLWGLVAKHFEGCQIPSHFAKETACGITDILYVLSSSYMAGLIFYLLTVRIPYITRRKIIRKHIQEVLRYLKDSFYDAFASSFGADWYSSEEFGENFYVRFLNDEIPNPSAKQYLFDYVAQIDRYLYSALSYPEYLYDDELEALYGILNSRTLSKIRHSFSEKDPIMHTKDQVIEILNGFQLVFIKIEKLFDSFNQ